MKTYIFKVTLAFDKRIYREIEILENQLLDDLHLAIFKAFEFEEMHLYSFFMSNKPWDQKSEYCSPHADGRSAKKITISSLKLLPKQKFLYIFDYGDDWRFEVEFCGNGDFKEKQKYPKIIKSVGQSPKQYPDEE